MPGNKAQVAALSGRTAGFGLNRHVVTSRIVAQITFVYAKKQDSVPLGYEVAPCPNQNEIIVVVADYGY